MLLLGQRPLSASDADSELYCDRRSESERVGRALDLGLNVYVHGPPGIGRTSFLRHLERMRLRAQYVRLGGFETLPERLNEIERAVRDVGVLHRTGSSPLFESSVQRLVAPRVEIAADRLRNLRLAAAGSQQDGTQVVLVDDLTPSAIQELFGRWRDDMWQVPIQWVVAGTTPHLDPPADSFFDVRVELPQFDRSGLEELLRRRAASGSPQEGSHLLMTALPVLESVAPCTPRRALTVLRDLYLSDDVEELTSELSRAHAARAQLKSTANKVLEALMAHGPAHAGDERLLSEVGVTRSRIVQVLGELEEVGLVTAERVGRRKLYAPRTAPIRQSDAGVAAL